MPRAQLKVELEGELADLWTAHPDDEFRILAIHPTEDGLLGVLDGSVHDPEAVTKTFDESSTVRSSEVLYTDEQTVQLQFLIPEPTPYRAVLASGNLLRFPLTIRGRWVFCDITTSQTRLTRLKNEFETAGVTFELVSTTPSPDPTDLLTARQRRFVSEALERGYYDSPRRCSLTDLATELGVSKSTASVVLHRAEETIIKEFFTDSLR